MSVKTIECQCSGICHYCGELSDESPCPDCRPSRRRGFTTIEAAIVSGIMAIGGALAVNVAPGILDQARDKVETATAYELESPFGEVTSDQEAQAAAILSRAVGDPELEALARSVESEEDLEALRVKVLEKYYYVTAPARESRALEIMRGGRP